MSSPFVAAVVQSSPVVFETKATLAKVYDFDVVGHYARPDVFQLHVNEKAAPPVIVD